MGASASRWFSLGRVGRRRLDLSEPKKAATPIDGSAVRMPRDKAEPQPATPPSLGDLSARPSVVGRPSSPRPSPAAPARPVAVPAAPPDARERAAELCGVRRGRAPLADGRRGLLVHTDHAGPARLPGHGVDAPAVAPPWAPRRRGRGAVGVARGGADLRHPPRRAVRERPADGRTSSWEASPSTCPAARATWWCGRRARGSSRNVSENPCPSGSALCWLLIWVRPGATSRGTWQSTASLSSSGRANSRKAAGEACSASTGGHGRQR